MAAGHSWSTVLYFWFHFFVFLPLFHFFDFCHRVSSTFNSAVDDDLIDVRRILWCHNLRVGLGDAFENVVHVHARYERAREFAWKDPDVHLFHLSEKGAIFIRTTKGVDIYSSSVSPFCFISLVEHAEEFGLVPLEVFRRIASDETEKLSAAKDQNGAPGKNRLSLENKKVILIGSVARSGSTLILQHFEDLRGCQAISEPPAFINLAAMTVSDASRTNLFRHVLFFVAKALYRRPDVEIVAIKLPVPTPWILADAIRERKAFPFDARFLFTYRNPVPMMNSWLRLETEIHSDPQGYAKQLPIIGRFFPDSYGFRIGVAMPSLAISGLRRVVGDAYWRYRFAWWTSELMLEPDKEFLTTTSDGRKASVGSNSLTGHFFAFYMAPMLTMMELLKSDEFQNVILPIRYEVLTTMPEMWTTKMLPFCGIAAAAASAAGSAAASSAIQRDSQRESKYSQIRMSSHATKLLPEDIEKLDEVVRAAGFAQGLRALERDFLRSGGSPLARKKVAFEI